MELHGTERHTLLAYATMSNGRDVRVVGTIKRAASRLVNGLEKDEVVDKVVFGYLRRPKKYCLPVSVLVRCEVESSST